MIREFEYGGETLMAIPDGGVLVASKSEPGVWHQTSRTSCDCRGFAHRGTCRHQRTIVALVDEALTIAGRANRRLAVAA